MRKLVLYITALWLMTTLAAGASVRIAENGVANAVIVVASDSIPAERHAAAELAAFLHQVTGAEFAVVDRPDPVKSNLLVGEAAAKIVEPGFTIEGLGDEGIAIRAVGEDLILAGGKPRGTLYSVYTFLEDYAGCRWWTSTESAIPSKPTLVVGDLNVRYVPKIEYRSTDSPDAAESDYSVRNKYNGHDHRLFVDDGFHNVTQDLNRGGRKYAYVRSDKWMSHGMWGLAPPELYFEAHPEWFSMIDGKRTCELWHSSQCLTNEDLRKQMAHNAILALNWNPQATMISVEQVDEDGGENYCHCPTCLAVQEEEGCPAGVMIRFVNSVAADIEKKFPDTVVTTLAYHYSRKPPKLAKPRHNVIVRLCNIECSFSKPLSDECNQGFRDDLVGWSRITDRLYAWDYVSNFGHPLLPHPNLRVLGPNVKFFSDHSVKGIFAEAVTVPGVEMAELRSWVLAKLFWNPDLDGWKLVEEFVMGYYGDAGNSVMAYINTTHDAVEQSGDYLNIGSSPSAKFLSFDTLNKCARHIKAAEAAARNEPALRSRVRGVKLNVLYAFLVRWDELRAAAAAGSAWPLPESMLEAYREFADIANERKVDLGAISMTPDMTKCKTLLEGN